MGPTPHPFGIFAPTAMWMVMLMVMLLPAVLPWFAGFASLSRAREPGPPGNGGSCKGEATAWAAALGLLPAMTSSQVKDAAMAGFSSTDQSARLTRNELASIAPLLRAAFPFHLESNR